MGNPISNFLLKTYKVWVVILAAVIFFLGYNAYLVDYSLVNLKIVLDKTDSVETANEAKRLAAAIDYTILTEVASTDLQAGNMSRLEMAKDILSNIKNATQLKDIKLLLGDVVLKKEKKKVGIFAMLDNLIGRIFNPGGARFSKSKLESQAQYLIGHIRTLTDKTKLQQAYFDLGNVYTKLADFAKAGEAFTKGAAFDPTSAVGKKCLFNLAWNEKFRGNYDEAIRQFEELSKSKDEHLSSFSQYQVADSLKKKGEYEKAAALFQKLGKLYPREEFAQVASFQAGYINLYDLSDYDKAKEIFGAARTLFGDSSLVGQIEKKVYSDISLEYRKKGYAQLHEGQSLLLNQFYERANYFFDKALEIKAEDGLAYIGKALAYLWLGDNEKALAYGEQAVKLLPKDEVVCVDLGYIYIQLNYLEKAINEYKRFLSLNRKSYAGHYNLGYVYAIESKLSEALKEFRMTTKIAPDLAFAHNNLGWAYWQQQKYAYAIQAFREAVKLQPKFERGQYNLGMAYMVIGSYGEAKKAFEQISANSPEYGQVIYQLKQIEEKNK